MKNIMFLVVIFLILNCNYLQAQSKWFAAPLVGVSTIENKLGVNANLTLGRYITSELGVKPFRLRADICASYFYFSDYNIYSTAALVSAVDIRDKMYTYVSMGFGIQKIENHSKYDFIIPLRMTLPYTSYRLNEKMFLGLDCAVNLNLSDFWGGSPVYLGLFLGIGM